MILIKLLGRLDINKLELYSFFFFLKEYSGDLVSGMGYRL